MAAVDRNTGLPASPYGQPTSFVDSQVQGPRTTNTSTTGTTTTSGTQVTSNSNYTLNTTPAAKAAIDALIGQMLDRNNVSDAEAANKFPLATARYTPTGWVYTNPNTGLTMSPAEANRFNQQQTAKQQEMIKAGGMTAGGTVDQRTIAAERQTEIGRNREQQGKYSKEAAFGDAKALTDYFTRVLSEQQLPGILRAAEGAGASSGTTRALLMNDQIARASESAAKTGLDAAVQYGGLSNQLAATLEALTRQDPNSISNQLIQALSVAKGIEQFGSNASVTTTQQDTTQQQKSVANQGAQQTTTYRDYANPSTVSGESIVDTPTAYSPSSAAGTGYIIANPPEINGVGLEDAISKYGKNDTDLNG